MKRISQGLDAFGNPLLGSIPFSDTVDALEFAGAGVQSETVPPGATMVTISASNGVDVFANFTGTAAIPSANVTDGSASVCNPEMRHLDGATSISVAVNSACVVTFEYWS